MFSLTQVVNLRETLICATLSERAIKLEFAIQPEGNLQRLLVLMQSIQTGCKVEVSPKKLTYIPGIITNNQGVEFDFDCGTDRSIGYYLETLIILSLYGKFDIKVNLSGYTNDNIDQYVNIESVDSILNCLIPMVKQFAPEWECNLKINRRGFRPNPTGKVYFQATTIRCLKSINWIERGPFKKIRGVSCGTKIAPNLLNRLVSTCRGVFNDYIPDVWIHTDFQKSQKGVEFSNGYAISIVAESTKGCLLSVDAEYDTNLNTPEDVGERAALRLLDEIQHSGCVDTSNQQYALLLMAFSEKKISQIRIGRLSVHTIETLRIIRDILGLTFQISKPDEGNLVPKQQMEEEQQDGDEAIDQNQFNQEKTQPTMIFTCLGIGISNLSRIIT